MSETTYDPEYAMHELRKHIDSVIIEAGVHKASLGRIGGREISLVYTKLQEAKMWAGKVLEELGSELPKEYQDKAPNKE